HYSNPRIGEGIDSRSHAGNMYISASGNTYLGNLGLSVIHDYIDSDNTSSRSRFRGGGNWEYEKGQWYLSVNTCIPQTVRTNIMRETHSGSIMKQRGISFYMREPTFNELYWTGDPYASGNPDLSSEKVSSIYCNILHSKGRMLIAFESGLDIAFDLINWENLRGIYRPVNNQRVIRPRAGLIFSDRWQMFSVDSYLRFKPSIIDNVSDYSEFFSDILNLEAGHISNYYSILPYDPVMKYGLDLGVYIGDFFLYTGSRIESRRYINDYNTKYINGFMQITETGVKFSYERIEAAVAVSNPLNRQFEDIRGYPREGRTVKFTLILEDI
ncbi:MAG: hypothetical protein SVK54_02910, partial [candidate division WOR-3 bacterium]|nr:hypothetical protein [candidate division WOR-3 bacterium]